VSVDDVEIDVFMHVKVVVHGSWFLFRVTGYSSTLDNRAAPASNVITLWSQTPVLAT
jgi:hypothetical protein